MFPNAPSSTVECDQPIMTPQEFAVVSGLERVLSESILRSSAPLLISGEAGVGKAALARAIHALSPRKDGPFVEVACRTLVGESDYDTRSLFGYRTEEGHVWPGSFEKAQGGVILLRHIEALARETQHEIHQALEEGRVYPVDSADFRPVNFRLIATTEDKLARLAQHEEFDARLYVHFLDPHDEIEVLPLRRRPVMATAALAARYARFFGRAKNIQGLSPDAQEAVVEQEWPGNITQLMIAIRAACDRCTEGTIITPDHLSL